MDDARTDYVITAVGDTQAQLDEAEAQAESEADDRFRKEHPEIVAENELFLVS